MTRGYLVNEFEEKVGFYNINGVNEYYVNLYNNPIGYMTEKQLRKYALDLGLNTVESRHINF